MVWRRLAVAPGPFCSAMLRRLLNTPRTVSAAGWISIVCSSNRRLSANLLSGLSTLSADKQGHLTQSEDQATLITPLLSPIASTFYCLSLCMAALCDQGLMLHHRLQCLVARH